MQDNKIEVKIGNLTFLVYPFCYKKVGDTENMKFRLECPFHMKYNKDFDDLKSLNEYLNGFLEDLLTDLIMEM